MRVLADLIIPRDDRSRSATDAGVPQFIDSQVIILPDARRFMRHGLTWLDRESRKRFSRTFVNATDSQRRAILDDIAWPARAKAEMLAGTLFFTAFRGLAVDAFWTSQIGIADLGYIGNAVRDSWQGCPDSVLARLGLKDPAGD